MPRGSNNGGGGTGETTPEQTANWCFTLSACFFVGVGNVLEY